MARTVRDTRLDTRAARLRLKASKQPYWREVSQGAHLGYYRGKRVSKWIARFRPLRSSGGYIQTTLGVADDVEEADGTVILSFAQAQEQAREWFRKTGRGIPSGPYTVGEALDDYLAGFPGKSLSATRNKVEAIIRPSIGGARTSELSTDLISKWHRKLADTPARLRTSKHATRRNERPISSDEEKRRRRSTANRHLTVLKAALNQAFRNEKIDSDLAWRKVRPFSNVDAPKLRYLSEDEARALVTATSPEFRPMVQAALLTGARYGDLCTLRVRDFDARAATTAIANSKGGKPYFAYLTDEAKSFFAAATAGREPNELIFRRRDGKAWGSSHQKRRLEAASETAGIERVTYHDLRRTFGARLAMKGVPMAVIAEVLGHADERTTRRHYAHLAPSYVGDTVREHLSGFDVFKPVSAVA